VVKGKDKGFRYLAKKTKNTGKYSWKIPTTNKYPVGSKYKIKVMAFKGGNKINDLSDKTFSIVAASSDDSTGGGSTGGGSTGGGSTGGGNTGGGNTGGDAGGGDKDDHDGDATEDEPTGPPETDEGADVESTIRITSPTDGQTFARGDAINVSWEATGAAADMDICLKFIDPSGVSQSTFKHAPKDGNRFVRYSEGGNSSSYGTWTIRVSGLFEGDTCSATVWYGAASGGRLRARAEVSVIVEAPRANYCYDDMSCRSFYGCANEFIEGEARGNFACQAAVNEWVASCGAGRKTDQEHGTACSFEARKRALYSVGAPCGMYGSGVGSAAQMNCRKIY
jgi:hypothetical protein